MWEQNIQQLELIILELIRENRSEVIKDEILTYFYQIIQSTDYSQVQDINEFNRYVLQNIKQMMFQTNRKSKKNLKTAFENTKKEREEIIHKPPPEIDFKDKNEYDKTSIDELLNNEIKQRDNNNIYTPITEHVPSTHTPLHVTTPTETVTGCFMDKLLMINNELKTIQIVPEFWVRFTRANNKTIYTLESVFFQNIKDPPSFLIISTSDINHGLFLRKNTDSKTILYTGTLKILPQFNDVFMFHSFSSKLDSCLLHIV